MNKSLLSLAAIFILFLLSCKKKDTTPASNTSSGGGTTGGNVSGITTSNATAFYGLFTTGNYTTILSGTTYTSTGARAYFSSSPTPYMNNSTSVKVSSVYLNGDSLSYSTSSKYYLSSLPVNLSSETWSLNGANGIGTFSYTNNVITPSASNLNSLPDSISKSTGFSVNINNIANITSASLLVFDGTGNISGYYTATLSPGNNSLTVSPSNLSTMTTATNAVIAVALTNAKAINYSGKDYQLSREAQYTKYIKIKP